MRRQMTRALSFATATLLLPSLAAAGVAVAGPLEEGKTTYERGDYATALGLWLPLANKGNAEAQHRLGNMYTGGQGVPQDYAEAVKWYRKAANQGNADAQNALGDWYEYGWGAPWGVPKDKVEAVEWYRRAAAQGNEWAQYHHTSAARMACRSTMSWHTCGSTWRLRMAIHFQNVIVSKSLVS
jgi:TPR repeat protein